MAEWTSLFQHSIDEKLLSLLPRACWSTQKTLGLFLTVQVYSCHPRLFISLCSWKYNSEAHLLWHSSLDVTKKPHQPKPPPEAGTTASSPIMEDVTLSHQGAQCEWIWTHSSSEGRWICLVAAGRTRNILSSSFLSLWLRKTSSQRRAAPVKLSKKMCCEMGTVYSFSKSDFNTENIEYLACL